MTDVPMFGHNSLGCLASQLMAAGVGPQTIMHRLGTVLMSSDGQAVHVEVVGNTAGVREIFLLQGCAVSPLRQAGGVGRFDIIGLS